MANDKIDKARDLIDEGKYAQARKLLKGLKDPKAKRLMDEIDDLAPARSEGGAKDALQVILMGLIFTALFGGIGYVVASSMGIPKSAAIVDSTPSNATPIQNGDVTQAPQSVAIEPTAPPPPTDIACEAQAWWDANGSELQTVLKGVTSLAIDQPPAQIQAVKASFDTWKEKLQGQQVAECMQPIYQSIVNVLSAIETNLNSYVTVTTDQERAKAFLSLMDALLPLTDAIEAANFNNAPVEWMDNVQAFTRSDCPAGRWFIETFFARDYIGYFHKFEDVDLASLPASQLQTMMVDFRSGRSSFAADSASFPECVKPASDHFVAMMDAILGVLNAGLNADPASMDSNLNAMNVELRAFETETEKIAPDLKAQMDKLLSG
jgi:hypothetical protein